MKKITKTRQLIAGVKKIECHSWITILGFLLMIGGFISALFQVDYYIIAVVGFALFLFGAFAGMGNLH